jgi:excisionase family DNA binding protein
MKPWSIPDNLLEKSFISPNELKKILNVSLPTIYRLVYSRKIPAFKIRNTLRFMREDVIAFLESNRIDQIK